MKLKNFLLTAAMAATLSISGVAMAQNDNGGGGGGGGRRGGNFDPAQFQQRMMENIRDQMNVTNNEEWQVIEARVQKVMDARRDVGGPNFGRLFRRRGGNEGDNNGGGRRGGFGGPPSPEQDALDKAVESNAPTEQMKAAMQKYRDSRKAKEAALAKAQNDLKQVLSLKQEAVALSLGLVN